MPNTLAKIVFTLAASTAHPGGSPYSFEAVTECGTDPEAPACDLTPACDNESFRCRAPFWSTARGAWVRPESEETARARFRGIAEAIANVATRLTTCEPSPNQGDEEVASQSPTTCPDIRWSGTAQSLALSALTLSLFESGLREDVQHGHAPLGRGQLGEACLVQVRPKEAVRVAPWITEAERERLMSDSDARETFAQTLLGDDPEALERCFEIGMILLARARRSCERSGPWARGMFSMYGSGGTCNLGALVEPRRQKLDELLVRARTLAAKAKEQASAP